MRVWMSGKGEDGAVTVGISYCHACYELEAWVIVGGFPMVRVSVFKEGGRSILFYFTVCQHGASRDTRRADSIGLIGCIQCGDRRRLVLSCHGCEFHSEGWPASSHDAVVHKTACVGIFWPMAAVDLYCCAIALTFIPRGSRRRLIMP